MIATFKFDPDLWLRNKDLRACSPAARGFWVDMLCLCHPAGYLLVNGKPVDDTQLARMVGEPVKSVRAWLKELGEAGIFSVDDRGLHSSKMVKEAAFVGQAKAAGARGAERKKSRQNIPKNIPQESEAGTLARPVQQTTAQAILDAASEMVGIQPAVTVEALRSMNVEKSKAKPLPWYKSPAGWARKGAEQGVSLIPGEDFEDFKARVAGRMPQGPHLDALVPFHRKVIEDKFVQYALKEGEKPWHP